MPISVLRKSQKTSLDLDNLYVVTESSEEAILVGTKELERVTYIWYFIVFPGDVTQDGSVLNPVSVFLDPGSEVNVMYLAFIEKLGFMVQIINVDV